MKLNHQVALQIVFNGLTEDRYSKKLVVTGDGSLRIKS